MLGRLGRGLRRRLGRRLRRPRASASGVDSAVGSGVASAVGSGVTSAVGSGVDSAVGSGVDSAVGSGVTSGVGSGVDSAVGSGVTSAVGSGVDSAVGSGVTSAVGSGVDSAVGSGVTSGVGSAVGSGVGSAVGSGVGSTVGSGVAAGDGPGSLDDAAPCPTVLGDSLDPGSGRGTCPPSRSIRAPLPTIERSATGVASVTTGGTLRPGPIVRASGLRSGSWLGDADGAAGEETGPPTRSAAGRSSSAPAMPSRPIDTTRMASAARARIRAGMGAPRRPRAVSVLRRNVIRMFRGDGDERVLLDPCGDRRGSRAIRSRTRSAMSAGGSIEVAA